MPQFFTCSQAPNPNLDSGRTPGIFTAISSQKPPAAPPVSQGFLALCVSSRADESPEVSHPQDGCVTGGMEREQLPYPPGSRLQASSSFWVGSLKLTTLTTQRHTAQITTSQQLHPARPQRKEGSRDRKPHIGAAQKKIKIDETPRPHISSVVAAAPAQIGNDVVQNVAQKGRLCKQSPGL